MRQNHRSICSKSHFQNVRAYSHPHTRNSEPNARKSASTQYWICWPKPRHHVDRFTQKRALNGLRRSRGKGKSNARVGWEASSTRPRGVTLGASSSCTQTERDESRTSRRYHIAHTRAHLSLTATCARDTVSLISQMANLRSQLKSGSSWI